MAELKIYAKPSSLYRYRPLGEKATREVRALREGFIYCPAYSAMNDPMEGLHRLSSRLAENPGSQKSRVRIQDALENMVRAAGRQLGVPVVKMETGVVLLDGKLVAPFRQHKKLHEAVRALSIASEETRGSLLGTRNGIASQLKQIAAKNESDLVSVKSRHPPRE